MREQTTRTIHVVTRNWYEDFEIVAAFESDEDAQQFAALESRRSRWHYRVHSTELRPAAPDKANAAHSNSNSVSSPEQ